jgi:large subunit ribosomal protein L5
MDRLKEKYDKTLKKEIQEKLKLKNPMATPRLTKIILNMGVKDAVSDKKNIERATNAMLQIAGQKPKITRAKKSIATFKLREGDAIGVMVTLRGKRMYKFYDKLVSIVLPRIKDFRGVRRTSFDSKGNYTLGLPEYAVFPEIDIATVERMQGLEININTSAKNKDEAIVLLEALGMPFVKEAAK